MRTIRIGELLLKRGLLKQAQVNAILEAQASTHRPFGEIAENMYGIDPTDIESAWVEQYAAITQKVDVLREEFDPEALKKVDRRQAWQFRVLPVRFDGTELMVATTAENLCRALRFVTRCLNDPCYLVVTGPDKLGPALERHYPLPGMNSDFVRQPGMQPMALLSDEQGTV